MTKTLKHISDISAEALAKLKLQQANPELYRPIKIGIPEIDEIIGGIVIPSYVAVGGIAKIGKTSVLTHIANALAESGRKVIGKDGKERDLAIGYYHLEEVQNQFAFRMLTMGTQSANRTKIRDLTLTEDDFRELDARQEELKERNIFMTDDTFAADKMIATATKDELDIIFVDTFNLMTGGQGANVQERMMSNSGRFIQARNTLGQTWIVAYQINDEGKSFGSRTFARDCDLIMEVEKYEDQYSKEPTEGVLAINIRPSRQAKEATQKLVSFSPENNRIGPLKTTTFNFDKFEEIAALGENTGL